jgi:hypothetical protein
MDKTIEIVVVAMVAIIVASILMFLVQGRATSFDSVLGDQEEGAQCEFWKAKSDTMDSVQVDDFEQKYIDNRCGEYAASEDSDSNEEDSSVECSTKDKEECLVVDSCEWNAGTCNG